jgi:antitoxin component YwqK of YwqJK toxin-antitoxin module
MLDGVEVRYDNDGKKLSEVHWVEGRRHGTTIEYDANGKPAKQLCYVHAEEGMPPAREGPCAQDELDVPKPD